MFESKELLKRVDYLESERYKLWERLTALEKEAKLNTSSYEKDAKSSSRKAAEFRNKAEERRDSIEDIYMQSVVLLDDLKSIQNDVRSIKGSVVTEQSKISEILEALKTNLTDLESKIEKIDDVFEEYPDLDDDIANLSNHLKTSQDNSLKITSLLKVSTDKKKDIDEIYYEIAGYDDENEETGETEHVEGLKDKLEEQYSGIEQKLKDLKSSFDKLLIDKTNDTDKAILEWKDKYATIIGKIESLLPNALTAGLSHAYSKKKEDEVKNYEQLKIQFNKGIIGLTCISAITVIVSIYFIYTGTPFLEVLKLLPNIAVAIIPLYIPMLWFTFAANKKVNLSKRLIEEYTHKEVISKTFEGLSTQIENLEDSDISKDLRLKLLFNLLEISNENPGKLISDYKNSDHPLLEVIKQQAIYERTLSRAKEYPELNKLTQLLANGDFKNLKHKKNKIEKMTEELKTEVEL